MRYTTTAMSMMNIDDTATITVTHNMLSEDFSMTMNTVAIGVGLFVGSCDVIGPPSGSSDVFKFVIEFVVGLEVGLEVGSNVCEDIGFPSPGPVGNRNFFQHPKQSTFKV